MKKTFFLLAALAVLAGCGNQPKPTENPTSKQDVFTVETYQTDDSRLLGIIDNDGKSLEMYGFVACEIDIPVTKNQQLYDSICHWFAQCFGTDYDENPNDVKAMVEYYKSWPFEYDEDIVPEGFDMSYTFKMLEANDRYVTYSFSSFSEVYSYPRANFETTYVTFDRNTGKRFTRQMVNKDESLELLVMNALLEQYFSEWDSEVLADILVFDPDDLEEAGFWLPEFTDPYLLNDNLCFYYWEHDIANRVAGQPYCALPYDVIEPYLTEEGKQYFKH